jgi:hypothetical protein
MEPMAGPGRFCKGNIHTRSTASDGMRNGFATFRNVARDG